MITRLFILILLNASICRAGFWSSIIDTFWYRCDIDLKNDVKGLVRDLESNVFGQPLVTNIVINAVKGHINGHPTKPLALSFHGWPGSGKNYVADFIAKNLYHNGLKSEHVHYYAGKAHFTLEREVGTYQKRLLADIAEGVGRCARSLFIFDEVDKIPRGVLDVVKPFLDYRHHIDGIDYRKATFIFMSNIGSNRIIERTLELWRNGVDRDDYQMSDFENLLTLEAFNDEGGGFFRSNVIESHLIDHYVPFLPLTKDHIRLCVEQELRKSRAYGSNNENIAEYVLSTIPFGPNPEKLFSVSGCKRVSQLVKLQLAKERTHWEF